MCYIAFLQYQTLSPPPFPLFTTCPPLLCGSLQMEKTYLLCKHCAKGSTVGTIQFEHTHTVTYTCIHTQWHVVTSNYTHTHTHTHREKCVPLIKTMLTACIQLLPCLLHKKHTKRSLVLVVTKFNAAKPILVSAILRDEFTCLSFTQYNSAQDLGGNRQLCRGSPVQFCKRQGGGRYRDSSKCMVPTFWRVRLLYSFSWVCPSPPGACHAGWVLFPLTAIAETDFANSAAPGVQPEATAGIYQS